MVRFHFQCSAFPLGWNNHFQAKAFMSWFWNNFPQQSMFPTEEAIRQKQKKACGHVAKPRPKKWSSTMTAVTISTACKAVSNRCRKQKPFLAKSRWWNMFATCLSIPEFNALDAMPMRQMSLKCFGQMEATCLQQRKFVMPEPRIDVGIDCMEMFGGQGTTTYILSKFHGLRIGIKFEMLCGVDLSKQADVKYLFAYIRRNKPKVILLAPPCRGYPKWGHLNRKINYEAWVESRQLSVPLARLSGEVANEQLSNGRHFFAEQPQGSGLYEEPPWLKRKDHVVSRVFGECMTGLRKLKPPFLPVRKPTECKASHPALLMFLQNLRCDGSHEHAHIGSWGNGSRHTVESADMQVWHRA